MPAWPTHRRPTEATHDTTPRRPRMRGECNPTRHRRSLSAARKPARLLPTATATTPAWIAATSNCVLHDAQSSRAKRMLPAQSAFSPKLLGPGGASGASPARVTATRGCHPPMDAALNARTVWAAAAGRASGGAPRGWSVFPRSPSREASARLAATLGVSVRMARSAPWCLTSMARRPDRTACDPAKIRPTATTTKVFVTPLWGLPCRTATDGVHAPPLTRCAR